MGCLPASRERQDEQETPPGPPAQGREGRSELHGSCLARAVRAPGWTTELSTRPHHGTGQPKCSQLAFPGCGRLARPWPSRCCWCPPPAPTPFHAICTHNDGFFQRAPVDTARGLPLATGGIMRGPSCRAAVPGSKRGLQPPTDTEWQLVISTPL